MFGIGKKKRGTIHTDDSAEHDNETPTQTNQNPIPEFGPYDGDSVNFRDFDFSDFAKGGLDLGSMMIPIPYNAEVQVEMGQNGPQMVHVLTPFGRITPVAFAAPRNGDLWQESIQEIVSGMQRDGLSTELVEGPWGTEISATAANGKMHVMGVLGQRWMLRFTLAGPADSSGDLVALSREILGRTFVNRGKDPIPAGNSLPVTIPQSMAQALQEQMEQHAQAQAADSALQQARERKQNASAPEKQEKTQGEEQEDSDN